MSLKDLSLEIHILIMSHAPDWPTLRALLRASPQHLRAFRMSRTSILPHVVGNQVDSDPVLATITQLERYNGSSSKIQDSSSIIQALPHGFAQVQVHNIPQARTILQLEWTIKSFITDFTATRLSIIQQHLNAQLRSPAQKRDSNTPESMPLSPVEQQRLKRAFYNLELYHYINKVERTCLERGDLTPVGDITASFLARMAEHELEEFLCVYQYFLD